MNRPLLLAAAFLLVGASGCDYEFTGPDAAVAATVRVRVTGGLANSDFTYDVTTPGHVTGVECLSGCAFAPGDTLVLLTPAQQEAVLDAVNRSGLPTSGRPVDFGTECCDQLTFRVTYSSGREIRTFAGSIGTFPAPLRSLVETLQAAFRGAPPLILRQFSGLSGLSVDPLTLRGARVESDGALAVDVRYGGGCSTHDVDAVMWTDWAGVAPAEVGVALTHDDHDDACDALISRTLRFDLEPLRQSYAAVYSAGGGDVVLRLTVGGTGSAILVPYSF